MIDNATLKMQFLFSLRKAGIVDKQVLGAMERVDRQDFINNIARIHVKIFKTSFP